MSERIASEAQPAEQQQNGMVFVIFTTKIRDEGEEAS